MATSAKPKSTTIVVCETNYGLRLAAQTIPLSEKPETDAVALQAIVQRAIERHAAQITEIVAVPPLVSGDLSYEYNHLQGAYAALVQQTLDSQAGIVTVELAEAQAINKELTTAGAIAIVRRPLPIYLFGEFRHQGKDGEMRVRLQLRAVRGEAQLGQREATLRPDKAPIFLQAAARELIGGSGQRAWKTPDPRIEARQLTDRAVDFQRLGQWEESMPLLEAALLLEPTEERYYRAMVACSHLTTSYGCYSKQTEEDKKAGRRYFVRGLEHLEEFFASVGKVEGAYYQGPRELAYRYPCCDFKLFLNEPSKPDSVAVVEKEREILLRILRKRVRGGYNDEGWIITVFCGNLAKKEYLDLVYGLLVEFKDLPGQKDRLQSYVLQKYGAKGCRCPEGDEFIATLERSDDAVLRGCGAWLRMERKDNVHVLMPREIGDGPRLTPASQAAQFATIQFPIIAGPGKGRVISGFLSCTAAGADTDIAWDRNHVYAIESNEGLKELWSTEDNSAIVHCAGYDGRYLWAAVEHHRASPWLLVIDPQRQSVRQFGEDSGLPIQPPEKLPERTYQGMLVAPVSPGCACVAGDFGRSWIALVKYDPQAAKPLNVDVFHEARRTWDGANTHFALDVAAAFQPSSMTPLTDWAGDAPGARLRILVGRTDGNHTDINSHPLIVDPTSRSVAIVSSGHHVDFMTGWPLSLRTFGIHRGSVYFLGLASDWQGHHLYRLGFPELEPIAVMDEPPEGCIVSYGNNLHIVGEKWWRLRPNGELDDLGATPWAYDHHYGKSRWINVSRDSKQPRPLLREICFSRHYGLLAITHNRANSNQNNDWVTYHVSLHEEKAVPAVPIVTKTSPLEKIVAQASEVIGRNPKNAAAWNLRALIYHRFAEWKKAESDSTDALRLDPQFAVAYNTRAVSRLYLGNVEGGIADLNEAIRLDPNFADAYNNRGVVRFRKGDIESAEADFTAAIRANPKFALAYCDRGALYRKKRDFQRTIADYTEAIRVSPMYAPGYIGRADVYEDQGDFQRGWRDRAEEQCLVAAELMAHGNLDGAETCLGRALKYDPTHARAYHQRGLVRARKGNAAGAAEDSMKAAQLDPSYTTAKPTPKSSGGAAAISDNAPAKAPAQ